MGNIISCYSSKSPIINKDIDKVQLYCFGQQSVMVSLILLWKLQWDCCSSTWTSSSPGLSGPPSSQQFSRVKQHQSKIAELVVSWCDNEHLWRIIISWTKTKAVWPMKQSVYKYKRLGLAGKTANLVKSIMNQYLWSKIYIHVGKQQ